MMLPGMYDKVGKKNVVCVATKATTTANKKKLNREMETVLSGSKKICKVLCFCLCSVSY